jgi:hypothetical protein
LRPFQNFSSWNGLPGFNRKTGLLAGFSRGLFKTNRVGTSPVSLKLALAVFQAKALQNCVFQGCDFKI